MNLENASLLSVTGDVTNSGTLGAGLNGGGTGGNTITIGGMLTNSGTFSSTAPGYGDHRQRHDQFRGVDLEDGSKLTVTGAVLTPGPWSPTLTASAAGTR